MKRNGGFFYDIYKEWKVQLDLIAPVTLAIIGMLIGFYIKKQLFLIGIDESVSSGTMAALTAAPVALYNRVINNYASKIQEDKDCDELEEKNKKIASRSRTITRLNKKIKSLQDAKIKAYQAHKKTSEKIQNLLNQPAVDHELRIAICTMLHVGDGDIFKLTISSEDIHINDEPPITTSNAMPNVKPIKEYSGRMELNPGDIN